LERWRGSGVGRGMFIFFSNGFGVVGSIVVSLALTLLLLYACSGP
jgi:predicted NBD/HSP70 family sugar kinase